MAQSERRQDQEPHHHDRPEIPSDTRCSPRLNHEECDENDPGGRQHIGLKACADAGCRQNALGSRKHGDRRRYETVAIEQGCTAHAENENETGPASDDMLGQGHQGERPALTLVVGPQDEENIFHRHDQGESPKDQRDDPENSRFGGTRGMGQCLAHGIKRARADVPEHHADRSKRQCRKAVLCGCRERLCAAVAPSGFGGLYPQGLILSGCQFEKGSMNVAYRERLPTRFRCC